MSVRRVAALAAIALVLAGLGYCAYWFHAAAGLRKGIEAWAESRRAENWIVGWDSLSVDGFPLSLTLTMESPAVTTPDGRSWQVGHLVAVASPLTPNRFTVDMSGRHHLGWSTGAATVNSERMQVAVTLDRHGRTQELTLVASEVDWADEDGIRLEAGTLAATWAPTTQDPGGDINFSVAAQDIHWPTMPTLPLEPRIRLMETQGRLVHGLPETLSAESVAGWSADGGMVELEHLTLDWAPLALEAQGTLSLGPDGQPRATLSTRMRGIAPLMDRLADNGVLPADTAQSAKIVLMLMSRPDSQGRPAVPVPVSLQDGEVYLGSARVAQLPAVKWP